jgi:hypothetical protein
MTPTLVHGSPVVPSKNRISSQAIYFPVAKPEDMKTEIEKTVQEQNQKHAQQNKKRQTFS